MLGQFEVAADIHARQLGWGIDGLNARGHSWIMTRIWGEFLRQPKPDEGLRIATFPSKIDRLLTYRDFILEDAQEQILGHVRTEWLIIDLESRKAQRLPSDIQALVFQPPQPEPLLLGWTQNPTYALLSDFVVGEQDLDVNRHMNNRRYLERMLESQSGLNDFLPRYFDVRFKSEALSGEPVAVFLSREGNDVQFKLEHKDSSRLMVTFNASFI